MKTNILIKKGSIFIVTLVLIILLTGCSSKNSNYYYEDLLLVTYDGNGGYLRNKSDTIRKLRVHMNSKIPNHKKDTQGGMTGEDDPYSLSSLGIAKRKGYNLIGWYLEENATYKENEFGSFVYLDLNYNNGMYVSDPAGEYELNYIENESGLYIRIYVQTPEEGVNVTNLVYIYFEGAEGYGFYIYDSDNSEHAKIYALGKSYKYADIEGYLNSYLVYDSLLPTEKELFKDVPRLKKQYTKDSTGAEKYSLVSGYVEIGAMMVLNSSGNYVNVEDKYELYDKENALHQDLERYSISENYLFTPSENVFSPLDLQKYVIEIKFWDFSKDRVTKDIVLKAYWAKRLTVEFYQKVGPVKTITTKMNPELTREIPLVQGEPIGSLEAIPLLVDHTFVSWSKSETEYIPWDFENDVFPLDSTVLKLYPYMVEGTYTRITSALDLSRVVNNPEGKYLLTKDIDLDGAEFANKSPLGFALSSFPGSSYDVFKGEFLSLGHKIKNFTIKVSNSQKNINKDAEVDIVLGLFPYVQNATIEGVIVEDMIAKIDNDAKGTNVILDLGAAGIVGTALEGETIIKDCSVDITFIKTSSTNVIDKTVFVGDIIAVGKEYATISECSAIIDYTGLTGITTGSLSVVTLN